MCHLVLLLPFIALPMLWLLPMSAGVPLYGVVLALSIAVYVMTFKAMRLPITTGAEALINATGTVESVDRRSAYAWVAGEHWAATWADGVLAIGDTVEVIGREGLTLQVRKLARRAATQPERPPESVASRQSSSRSGLQG